MLKKLKKLWSKWVFLDHAETPVSATAAFELRYGAIVLGRLTVKEGRWRFEYTDAFRRSDLGTLVQFPDPSKTYESEELWPFFGLRIPSLCQPSVKAVVKREHLDEKDTVQLLRRFGRRTIANPYELVGS